MDVCRHKARIIYAYNIVKENCHRDFKTQSVSGGPLRLSFHEHPQLDAWEFTKQRARRAEQNGFTCFWLMDHFYNFHGKDETAPFLDGWTTLPALAMVTNTIRLAPLVTPVGYRNPALLARMCATFHGKFFRVDNAICESKPIQKPLPTRGVEKTLRARGPRRNNNCKNDVRCRVVRA